MLETLTVIFFVCLAILIIIECVAFIDHDLYLQSIVHLVTIILVVLYVILELGCLVFNL